jgi:UDP-N-acetyl-D-mannosaminuronic acid dehydrogenase
VVVVGGCGHVGLPLAITFAETGLQVAAFDINGDSVDRVNAGQMPFDEPGSDEVLRAVAGRTFRATTDPTVIGRADTVVVVIGTPVDEHLNPDPEVVPRAIAELLDHFVDGQLLVLRSTIYPGVTALVERMIEDRGRRIDVAFCPERIAEGVAMEELRSLPQIVSGRTSAVTERAAELFSHITTETVELSPEEAELAKLFTNTWRYIKFASANQLYMIANDFGLDYERIRDAISHNYPRGKDLPRAGFAAGPCLLKDTLQLAAFNNNNFSLGHASMMINEGLPLYLVGRMEQRWKLSTMNVGLLGMAFKGESDDVRSSLSYKLKRILKFKAQSVLCSDPYVRGDQSLLPLDQVLASSDVLVIGAPHRAYRQLPTDLPIIDIWDLQGEGVRV